MYKETGKKGTLYKSGDCVEVRAAPGKSGEQFLKSCQHNFCFFSGFLGNFQREAGSMLLEISGQGTCYHKHSEAFLENMRCF
jgi:hypothetical protein